MRELIAEFELVTPAFCGGADQTQAEMRLPSILGQLRWWWRALAWGRASGTDPNARLKQIHDWECALFGSAEGGAGAFTARLKPRHYTTSNRNYGYDALANNQSSGIAYCAGQGLGRRHAICRSNRLEITMRQPRQPTTPPVFSVSNANKNEPPCILEAIWALGMLGSLGARSRRGFGSLSLVSWNAETPVLTIPDNVVDYQGCLTGLRASFTRPGDGPPPYSAFAPCTMMAISSKASPDAASAHAEAGGVFLDYRNCRNRPTGKRFLGDHDWFYSITGGGRHAPPAASLFFDGSATVIAALGAAAGLNPERGIFGFPHNYSRRHPEPIGPKNEQRIHRYEAKVVLSGRDRRASPLLLHVHRVNDNSFVGVWVLFESEFLPDPHPSICVSRSYSSHLEQRNARGRFDKVFGSQSPPLPNPLVELPFRPSYVPAREFLTNHCAKFVRVL